MPLYNLEVLNDKEFEELCKNLLERELELSFQIFKSGRDKGIDLRYACDFENEIIVQAKQYIRSSYAMLKRDIKGEVAKMDKLVDKPRRYILMTGFDLSVGQIDELALIMTNLIRNSQDIYARERIVNLISKYPDVEKKYYKLWLTSTNVLTKILHNGTNGRSEFLKEKILKKAALYVPTQNFTLAIDKLRENHFLIISGEPGIGKTTISYLLICDLLANGYELIYIDDHLRDAEDLLSTSSDVKQVVFFDDFFGANLSEILNPRNTEGKIISFIERIQSSTNKFLVMTTRTTILKQAQYRFEKFNRSGLADLSKFELEIKAYSKFDRAQILYNHMFHSGMAIGQYDIFFKSHNYLKIIDHKNYFPRLIEFITSKNQLKNLSIEETEHFIFNSLDNPEEIWHYAYDQQLNEEEKILLLTLFSLGGYNVPYDKLEKAFQARYAYEIKENGFSYKTDAYQLSIKKLLGGFIKGERNINKQSVRFDLLNPSVGDFLLNFLQNRFGEIRRIINSVIYFEQITIYFGIDSTAGIELSQEQLKDYYPQFNALIPQLLSFSEDIDAGRVTVLYIWLRYFRELIAEEQLIETLKETDLFFTNDLKSGEISYVLSSLDMYDSTKEYIVDNWEAFFIPAVKVADDSYSLKIIVSWFDHYEIEDWSSNQTFISALGSQVNQLYSADDVDLSDKSEGIISAYYEGFHSQALEIVENKISDNYFDFLKDCGLSDFYDEFHGNADYDSLKILDDVVESYNVLDDDYDPMERIQSNSSSGDENEAIYRLFER